MSTYLYQVDDTLLQQITQAIVEAVHPVKILLFGSRARGDNRPDSDLDLLIIVARPFSPEYSRWELLKKIRQAIRQYRVPKDLLAYSKEEEDYWKDSLNHIIGECHRQGRLLYERS
jgi:uncharacterized protein